MVHEEEDKLVYNAVVNPEVGSSVAGVANVVPAVDGMSEDVSGGSKRGEESAKGNAVMELRGREGLPGHDESVNSCKNRNPMSHDDGKLVRASLQNSEHVWNSRASLQNSEHVWNFATADVSTRRYDQHLNSRAVNGEEPTMTALAAYHSNPWSNKLMVRLLCDNPLQSRVNGQSRPVNQSSDGSSRSPVRVTWGTNETRWI